jgi:hypothetical protein
MREAYILIKNYYGTQTARRSGVPLINHIDEGLAVLDALGASNVIKDAYCLHPILQNDDALAKNKGLNFGNIPTEAIILAMEYRRVANSYLSNVSVDKFVGFFLPEVHMMLIADKVQNYKDFMEYHYGTHERSDELYAYFHTWFKLLDIKYEDYCKEILG